MNSLIFGGQMTVETVPASLFPLKIFYTPPKFENLNSLSFKVRRNHMVNRFQLERNFKPEAFFNIVNSNVKASVAFRLQDQKIKENRSND
jgi:hypothetical protein